MANSPHQDTAALKLSHPGYGLQPVMVPWPDLRQHVPGRVIARCPETSWEIPTSGSSK